MFFQMNQIAEQKTIRQWIPIEWFTLFTLFDLIQIDRGAPWKLIPLGVPRSGQIFRANTQSQRICKVFSLDR